MEAATKRLAAGRPNSDAWSVVKRWPGVRGEVKIAWRDLYDLSDGGNQQVALKAGWLGAQQNTSTQAGLRYLETLKREGLIDFSELGGGVKLVTVQDNPLDVAKARRACAGDSQGLFSFLEELEESGNEYAPAVVRMTGEPAAEAKTRSPVGSGFIPVPPSEPERRSGSNFGTGMKPDKDIDRSARAFKTKTVDNQTIVHCADLARPSEPERRSGSEVGSGTPLKLGDVLPAIAAASGYTAVEALVERTAAAIQRIVADPRALDVVRVAAWAVEEGDLPRKELDRLLGYLKRGVDGRGQPIRNLGGYFRRQITIKFRELGITGGKPRPK